MEDRTEQDVALLEFWRKLLLPEPELSVERQLAIVPRKSRPAQERKSRPKPIASEEPRG